MAWRTVPLNFKNKSSSAKAVPYRTMSFQPESQSVLYQEEQVVFKTRDYYLTSTDMKRQGLVTGSNSLISNESASRCSSSQQIVPLVRTFVKEESNYGDTSNNLSVNAQDHLPNEDVHCHAVTSESLGPSVASYGQQGKFVTTAANTNSHLSQRLFGTSSGSQSNSMGSVNTNEENGGQNMSVQPSSLIPYQPLVSSVVHNKAETNLTNLDLRNESQNLTVTPLSIRGPFKPKDDRKQNTGIKYSRYQQEQHKPQHETVEYPTNHVQEQRQQFSHTNIMETTSITSQQTHASGEKSSPQYVFQHSSKMTHNHSTGPPVDITRRPNPQPKSIQYHDSGSDVIQQSKGKKVFILHYIPDEEVHLRQSLLTLAVCLRDMRVDVSIDMFERDITVDNWSIWYERQILSSNVVLCIITPNFYTSLTSGDRVKGYSVYNLLNNSKGIMFRAVFLDSEKNMEYVPLSMRGATCYSISSHYLSVHDEEFASLYAFLTGQNRVEKPPLGNVVVLAPKRSKCKFICYIGYY